MNYCHINKTNDRVTKIIVSNHAGAGVHGEDIVCAGISALCFTIAQQIMNIDKSFDLEINQEEAIFVFTNNTKNDKIDLLLETLCTGLNMMALQYSQYITVEENKTEV